MSTTRSLMEHFNLPTSQDRLQKVEPTKTFLITSMKCEKKAAVIRNKTVDSMDANNIQDVAYRFVQTRQGENVTSSRAILISSTLIIACTLYPTFYSLPCIWLILPYIRNSSRYRETKNSCEEWLSQKLGEQQIEQLRSLTFDSLTRSQVNDILGEANTRLKQNAF